MECGFLLAAENLLGERSDWPVCVRNYCHHQHFFPVRFCERCKYPIPLRPGAKVAGRYQITRHLYSVGNGGFSFGPIYEVKDQDTVPVVVREFVRCNDELFELGLPFFRSAYAKMRLLGSNALVPEVFDFVEEPYRAYIIMEYLPGPTLYDLLYDRGSQGFPIDEIIEWGKTVCDLLDMMHAQRPPLLKRGFDLDDILLDKNRQAKLVNFGFARERSLYWNPLRVFTY